jgi:dihydroxy-acid dehydratase
MPEMLTPTSAIMGAGLGNDVAMLTDGRFSGGSHGIVGMLNVAFAGDHFVCASGFIIGHITPEAQEGGPIALVEDGDPITIDCVTGRIDIDVSEQIMDERKKRWTAPPLKANRGTLFKYIKSVKSASMGCVTDE